jgi:hypothetical protein
MFVPYSQNTPIHWSLFWPIWIRFISPLHIFVTCILILFSVVGLHLRFSSGLAPLCLKAKYLCVAHPSNSCYVSNESRPPLLEHSRLIWREVQIINFPVFINNNWSIICSLTIIFLFLLKTSKTAKKSNLCPPFFLLAHWKVIIIHVEGLIHVTKPIVVFRNFANPPYSTEYEVYTSSSESTTDFSKEKGVLMLALSALVSVCSPNILRWETFNYVQFDTPHSCQTQIERVVYLCRLWSVYKQTSLLQTECVQRWVL